jgi:hypothetical protein
MGSHPTLAHPNPTWERAGGSDHAALEQRTAQIQPTRDREQAFDRLNPDYGVPADPTTLTATKPCATARRPSHSAPALPSPHPARTTPIRSCGWPARTTGSPMPPTVPACRRSASGTAHNGPAPNAKPP